MAGSLSPANTKKGTLPPFEVAKAYAFETVVRQMEKHTQLHSQLHAHQKWKAASSREEGVPDNQDCALRGWLCSWPCRCL